MEAAAKAVLDLYHRRIREESQAFRGGGQPGGRRFSRDDVLLAVGPETGQLLHILASSKKGPTSSKSARPTAIPASGWRTQRGSRAGG